MTWAIVAGVGGTVLGGVASGALSGAMSGGGGGPGPLGADEILNQLAIENRMSPVGFSSGLSQLNAQSAYGTGAGADQIAQEILMRQIGETKNPLFARNFGQQYSNLQSLLLNPGANPRQLQMQLDRVNRTLAHMGAGAQVSLQNGRAQIMFADPNLQSVVDTARQNSQSILQNRLSAQNRLSQLAGDFPSFGASDITSKTAGIQSQIENEINATYNTQYENLLQSANTRGFNPYGAVSELEKQRSRDLQAAPTTAAERALQILGGQQGLTANSIAGINAAISPDAQIAILNAMRNQQTPTTGQLAAAQIGANASMANNAANNRANVANNIGGSISDAGVLAGLLSRNRAQNTPGPGAPNPSSFSDFGGNSFDVG